MSATVRLILAGAGGVFALALASLAAANSGVSAEWMAAFADLIMAAGTVTAALWAIYSYRQAKQAEAARWVKDLFGEFFFNPSFDEIRDLVEFGYKIRLMPILQSAVLGRHLDITEGEDRRLLKELDNFLNYLEYVLYLESLGRIETTDRKAIFDYWTGVLSDDDHALVRLYCGQFGYERVAQLISAPAQPQASLLAVYGSLRRGESTLEPVKFIEGMRYLKPCRIRGMLLDLGDYPGLVSGDGLVSADLVEIADVRLWQELDRYEEFDPGDLGNSEYERVYCRLAEPSIDAWVYYYVGTGSASPVVQSGDWKQRGG